MTIEEKKRLKRDFFCRLSAVFFSGLGICLLISSVILTPALFISFGEKNNLAKELAKQRDEAMPVIDQSAQKAIQNLNNQLALIKKVIEDEYFPSEKIVAEVISQKTAGIKIENISYENSVKGKTVKVQGIARSREQLLLFRRALEESGAFKEVDLPISNFVKGSNIQFSLSMFAH